MSRRPRKELSPNLFPFLAVLVCTLGTLILLLALVAQKAESAAEQIADSEAASANLQIEEERWQAEELQKLRARQTAELEQRRSELAHLEDHLRRLREELAQLSGEAQAAETLADDSSAKQAETKLVALRNQIESAREEIEDLAQQRESRPPRVVIVPYKGTNGTERRPIYVECTDQAVIIQPEGVRITADQLEGPLGPGNPLDAALRAVRAHWQQTESEPQPPYPLLLVRPDGIHAYAACRVAMSAWDDQFGYELITADLRLSFPKADEGLRDKLVATIHDAVQRQQSKIAAMPGRYNNLSRRSTAGEFSRGGDAAAGRARTPATATAASDSSGAGSRSGGTSVDQNRARSGEGYGHGMARAESGPLSGSWNLAASGSNEPLGGGPPNDGRADADAIARVPAAGDPAAEGGGPVEGGGPAEGGGSAANGSRRESDQRTEGDQGGEYSNPLDGGGGIQTEGQIAGSAGSQSMSAPSQSGASAAASGGAPPSGMMSSMQSTPPPDPHAKTFSDAAPQPSQTPSKADRRESAAAASRPVLRAGNDWALPPSVNRRGTAIVRQMRLRCEADRFVLLPESHRSAAMSVIAIRDGAVEPAVMELATALRDRVESWGLAMQNGRWEPVLSVAVAAGAESRFADLQSLLGGSGIRVEREVPQ